MTLEWSLIPWSMPRFYVDLEDPGVEPHVLGIGPNKMDVLGVEPWLMPHYMSTLENGVAAGVPAKFLVRCQSRTKEFGLMNLLM